MPAPPTPFAVVLNATAGTGLPSDWVDKLRAQFAAHGMTAQVEQVTEGAQILPTVKRLLAAGAGTVVAGGGDGTVSAVASQLVGTDAVLGVLPLGTLNHFAKDLGMPLEQEAAVAALAAGQVGAVDVGEVNGRIFINNSSLGMYPDIVRDRERRQSRLGHSKWRALAQSSVGVLRRYPVLRIQIDLEDERHAVRTPFLFIGNNEYQMEGFQIGARSGLQSGVLALYTAQRTGRFGLLRLALLALLGRLQQARDFHTALAHEFVVHSGHRRLRVATDGEVTLMDTPLRYRTRPGALRVIMPPAPSAS